jgi:hypothetical protein
MTLLRGKSVLFSLLILATIITRASIPEGFMPSAPGSGLLFELCPSAVPAEVMQVLAERDGKGRHAHHAHHGQGAEPDHSSHDGNQCEIGHLLASAVAVDTGSETSTSPSAPEFTPAPVIVHVRTVRTATSSRGPPA